MKTTSPKRHKTRPDATTKIEVSWDYESKESREAVIWAVALIMGRQYYPPTERGDGLQHGTELPHQGGR